MRIVLSNRDAFRPSSKMVQALIDRGSELVTSLAAEAYQGRALPDAQAREVAAKRGFVFKAGKFYLVHDVHSLKTRSHPDFVAIAAVLGPEACFFRSEFDIVELEDDAAAILAIESHQGVEVLAPRVTQVYAAVG
jgi:hypothetical protein